MLQQGMHVLMINNIGGVQDTVLSRLDYNRTGVRRDHITSDPAVPAILFEITEILKQDDLYLVHVRRDIEGDEIQDQVSKPFQLIKQVPRDFFLRRGVHDEIRAFQFIPGICPG